MAPLRRSFSYPKSSNNAFTSTRPSAIETVSPGLACRAKVYAVLMEESIRP